MLLTFGQFKVGCKRSLVCLDQEGVTLGNRSKEELNGDAQLVNSLPETDSRSWGLSQRLSQVLARLRIVELNGFNPSNVVQVPMIVKN